MDRQPTSAGSSRATWLIGTVFVAALAGVGGSALRDWNEARRPVFASNESFRDGALLASTGQTPAIPEGEYFNEIRNLLRREYVDPIEDDQKLASGAVRGMVASLNDPNSMFMDKAEFTTFLNARNGIYEGIGAHLGLVLRGAVNTAATDDAPAEGGMTPEEVLVARQRVPRLMVMGVVPGGPADKAGVKPGDLVYSVNNQWIVNTDLLLQFRKAQADLEAKRINQAQFNLIRTELRTKSERALLPTRAFDILTQGKSGSVAVTWERAGTKRETNLTKATSTLPPVSTTANGTLTLRFADGGPAALKRALGSHQTLKIDLRNNFDGDFDTMVQCLALIGGKGNYGYLVNQRGGSKPISVKTGVPVKNRITLITDQTTTGVANMFARALMNRKLATGATGLATDPKSALVVQLADGSGYTLVTGTYQSSPGKTRVVQNNGGSAE